MLNRLFRHGPFLNARITQNSRDPSAYGHQKYYYLLFVKSKNA